MKAAVLKPTQDNFHGNYKLQGWYNGVENQSFVEVKFLGNITAYDPKRPAVWRTCVWGNDDLGMEYDCGSEAEARAVFYKLIELEYVNIEDLKNLGFVYA